MQPLTVNPSVTPATIRLSEIRLGRQVVRLYAIGQVHSDVAPLRAIDARISADLASMPDGGSTAIIQAGGLIDKGIAVAETLHYIGSRDSMGGARVTYMMGAHEELMLRAIGGDSRAALFWLLSGSEGSLSHWGVPTKDWVAGLRQHVPEAARQFLGALPGSVAIGSTRFVCSTFTEMGALPFGLFGRPAEPAAIFGPGPVVPVGRGSELMAGKAPDGWHCREIWTEGALSCAVLERMAS
jgi:hypothetical protein